jgi:hypothetical protein
VPFFPDHQAWLLAMINGFLLQSLKGAILLIQGTVQEAIHG